MVQKNLVTILARLIAVHEGAVRTVEPGEIFENDWAAVFEKGNEVNHVLEYVPGKNFHAKAEQFYELWITMKKMTD